MRASLLRKLWVWWRRRAQRKADRPLRRRFRTLLPEIFEPRQLLATVFRGAPRGVPIVDTAYIATPQPAGRVARSLSSSGSVPPTPSVVDPVPVEVVTPVMESPPIPASAPTPEPTPASALDAFPANDALGRGMNLGSALETQVDAKWKLNLEPAFFSTIKAAGFDHIRVPIRWSAHADMHAPYTIEPEFFTQIDWVLEQAQKNQLRVVLNMHHYDELEANPGTELPRAQALWSQIAARYADRGDWLYFELVNEPQGELSNDGAWNAALATLLATVRATNPNRTVIVGPVLYDIKTLPALALPDDPHVIVTLHYYRPFEVTHQGAAWTRGADEWLGTQWTASSDELKRLSDDFDAVQQWAQQNNHPIYLGEFGTYSMADMESRVRWTKAVAAEAEERGWSWAYWEFGAGFGVYDVAKGAWNEELKSALVGDLPQASPTDEAPPVSPATDGAPNLNGTPPADLSGGPELPLAGTTREPAPPTFDLPFTPVLQWGFLVMPARKGILSRGFDSSEDAG